MIFSFIGFSIALIAFGISALKYPNLIFVFIILLVMLGFSLSTFIVTNNTVLQLQVDDAYRGRVLSMLFLGFGLTSLGSFVMGWLAESLSAPVAYISTGGILLLLSIFLIYFTKEHKMHA